MWEELADDLSIGRRASRVAENGLVTVVVIMIFLGVAGYLLIDFDVSKFIFRALQAQ